MSLQPELDYTVPEQTARAMRAVKFGERGPVISH
jgi:hypothetical protein